MNDFVSKLLDLLDGGYWCIKRYSFLGRSYFSGSLFKLFLDGFECQR